MPDVLGKPYTFELPPALVQHWLDDAGANFGIVLVPSTEDGAAFDSSEGLVDQRPALSLIYVP